MACKTCNDKNKLVRTISWVVYLAPLAYSAYVFLKQTGALDKITEVAEPYLESAKDTVSTAGTTGQNFIIDKAEMVSDAVKNANPVEALKNALKDNANAEVLDVKDGTKKTENGK